MTTTWVIGLDVGTTGCKAVAVDAQGRVLAAAGAAYPMHCPAPDRAEQNVLEIWAQVSGALRALMAQTQATGLGALALSGAMHSLLLCGEDGEALGPATTWADGRAQAQATALRREVDLDRLYRLTGCPMRAIYHLPRLRWLAEHEPAALRKARRVAAIKDWISHRLTGRWTTDRCLASSTGLLDIESGRWNEGLLALAGVGPERWPELVEPEEQAGAVTKETAAECGLPAGLPVIAGGSDGGLANIGAGGLRAGQVVITVGTSGAIRRIDAMPRLDERTGATWCYRLARGLYFHGGAINNGGLALQWVRDRFYGDVPGDEGYARMLAEAEAVEAGCEGLVMLPYFTGERCPRWDSGLRASLEGLTLRHGRGHVARAAMEGVAMCLADVWALVGEPGGEAGGEGGHALLTGGIVRTRMWAQMVADALGLRLKCVEAADASALGAAALGHAAMGRGSDLSAAMVAESGPVLEPDARRHDVYRALHERFGAMARRNEQAVTRA